MAWQHRGVKRSGVVLSIVLALAACGARETPATGPTTCALPPPTVLRWQGNAVLLRWDLPASPMWSSAELPGDTAYQAYRAAIVAAGADLPRPIADPPPATDDPEVWRREDLNTAQMYDAGGGGSVRPIQCLEAALFALQHARHDELTHPTEFVSQVLEQGDRVRVYFGASDELFPPKRFYAREEVEADVAAGWSYRAVLHNHTIRTLDGKPALGSPAPSTNDVQLFRGLAEDLALREIWVTNGLYTGVVPAEHLGQFQVAGD